MVILNEDGTTGGCNSECVARTKLLICFLAERADDVTLWAG